MHMYIKTKSPAQAPLAPKHNNPWRGAGGHMISEVRKSMFIGMRQGLLYAFCATRSRGRAGDVRQEKEKTYSDSEGRGMCLG